MGKFPCLNKSKSDLEQIFYLNFINKNKKYIYIKMTKNKKIKRRQKGGRIDEEWYSYSENLASEGTSMTAGSNVTNYGKYNHKIFLWIILMTGTTGFIWFLLSRSLITHIYSEAISYGVMGVAIVISVFMLISIAVVYRNKKETGFKNMLKVLFSILVDGLPAWLILIQICVLISLMVNHADYLYYNTEKPGLFTIFNITSAILIFMQCYMWSNKIKEIIKLAGTGIKAKTSYVNIGIMVLLSILSGVCISQLYVILEMLRVDP